MGFLSGLAPMIGMGAGALIPGGGLIAPMIGGALGGAVAGNAKHQAALDRQKRSASLAAETARYSPWTGMRPGQIDWAGSGVDEIGGGALGGGMTGWSFGQALNKPPVPLGVDPKDSKFGNSLFSAWEKMPTMSGGALSYQRV